MIKVGVLGSVISNICKCEKYLKLWLVLLLSCLRHSENIDRTFFFVCETQNEKATKQTRNIKTSLSFTYPQDSDTWPMLLVTQALSGQVFLQMHRWIFSEFSGSEDQMKVTNWRSSIFEKNSYLEIRICFTVAVLR